MKFRSLIAPFAVMAALSVPVAALAHPKIVAATPAANATVAPTTTVRLTFSERVMPRLSSATLTMTSMPGTENHVMKVTGVTSAVSGTASRSPSPAPGRFRLGATGSIG